MPEAALQVREAFAHRLCGDVAAIQVHAAHEVDAHGRELCRSDAGSAALIEQGLDKVAVGVVARQAGGRQHEGMGRAEIDAAHGRRVQGARPIRVAVGEDVDDVAVGRQVDERLQLLRGRDVFPV